MTYSPTGGNHIDHTEWPNVIYLSFALFGAEQVYKTRLILQESLFPQLTATTLYDWFSEPLPAVAKGPSYQGVL